MKKNFLLSTWLMLGAGSTLLAQNEFPKLTVENDTTWYMISTPEREDLHLTSNGTEDYVTGKANSYANSQIWCFIASKNGQLNLLNRQNKSFISDKAASDKYFKSTLTAPETGFKLSLVESKNLYNILDASGQMVNQCKSSENYRLTNWNQSTDPGNLFRIEEVDVQNLQLSQAKNEARTLLNNTEEGTAPGTYSKENRDKLAEVAEQAQSVEEIRSAIAEYKKSMNGVTEGQFYFLVSTGPDYCRNRVLYNTKPTEGAYLRWGDKTIDENALWEFVKTGNGETDTYLLRNKATGLYLQATSNGNESGEVRGSATPNANTAFEVESLGQNKSFLIYTPGGNPIHAQNDFGVMVTWNSRNYGSASSWQIIPATENEIAQATQKTESDREDYKLVWQEEFNEDGEIDPNDWNFEYGFVRNNEDQWYQEDNASKKDGNLVIEARKERKDNPWYEPGSSDWKKSRQYIDYTSSCMTTAGKHDWLYGRVEVRAKIPCYSGSWPAIWMLGNESVTGEWPSSGEIDIMEYYKDKTLANLVWGSSVRWQGIWEARSTPVTGYWVKQDPNWTDSYHTWRMDWDEESIKLYLDDELITICNLSRTINQGEWHLVDNPFHTSQYLLLNLALGGNNGGPIDNEKLPFSYLVDYVRVYQKPEHITGIESNLTEDGTPMVYLSDYSCNINTKSFEGDVQATVYNLSGAPVAKATGKAENASMPVPVKHLSKGVYLVKVSDKNHSLTEKIVIK